jgi:hypothetical protein
MLRLGKFSFVFMTLLCGQTPSGRAHEWANLRAGSCWGDGLYRAVPSDYLRQPPSSEQWLRENKHDGFRVIARKQGLRRWSVRLEPGRSLARPRIGSLPAPMHGLRISNGLICNRWLTRQVALRLRCRMWSQGEAVAGYWLTDLAIFSGSLSYIYRIRSCMFLQNNSLSRLVVDRDTACNCSTVQLVLQ